MTALLVSVACSTTPAPPLQSPPNLQELVASVQRSVATVVAHDANGDATSIGSGFFISASGILVTNYHVLDGAYHASIRTRDGSTYPVTGVLAKNQLVDLIKVRVEVPTGRVQPIQTSERMPAVADRVVVVGSPMGLEQTVSEGIVSAIRDLPTGGHILQLTAPISQGSSGGPVVGQDGRAIGVVTFQAAQGQNLNFAVAVGALALLTDEPRELSIAEWTIRSSEKGPALAASLCREGSRLSIQGEFEEALTYFQRATQADPTDPEVWYGLGSCYAGLDQADDAVAAYQRPIHQNPDNAVAHYVLAMYYKATEQFERAILPLSEVIRIDPANLRARFELGHVYGHLQRTDQQIETFEKILADHPDHVPTLLSLGIAMGQTDRHPEAIDLFSRANDHEPDNPLILYNMGVSYNRMEQPERAIRAFTLAIRANPRMVAPHYHLGRIYLDRGDRKLALDQYEILKGLNTQAADRLFDLIYPDAG
jgi:tetratricopeptide (TPR) repeat protein